MAAIHYLETSALNVFADRLTDFDCIARYKRTMDVELCISPVVLWEVLLNSDDCRKDLLIHWAQFNCSAELWKSPAELLIRYLRAGAPLRDRATVMDHWTSELEIGNVWRRIHKRLDRTIPIDAISLQQRIAPLRELSRLYPKIIESMTDDRTHGGDDDDWLHRLMVKTRANLGLSPNPEAEDSVLLKTSLILVFFIGCIGCDLDNSPVRDYWQELGVDDPVERLEFLVSEMPMAIVRGPIPEMAIMLKAQNAMSSRVNRGAVFDAMHSIYCHYADNVISNDPHFTALAEHSEWEPHKRVIFAEAYAAMLEQACGKIANRVR